MVAKAIILLPELILHQLNMALILVDHQGYWGSKWSKGTDVLMSSYPGETSSCCPGPTEYSSGCFGVTVLHGARQHRIGPKAPKRKSSKPHLGCNPKQTYLGVRSIEQNGTFFQVKLYRTVL